MRESKYILLEADKKDSSSDNFETSAHKKRSKTELISMKTANRLQMKLS